ncbi:MAG: tRNA (adenosine(37)-N6)-threonylcarbamoyltransferase complex transferase subunit TsaD, partial [Alphaproteobacteria bacterium]|nr:tRNA (adenosine(37)-N6)-threonylcarbamoyltransferase complex transferase subunit TsaD [Alphaproteobacteria bacterium]
RAAQAGESARFALPRPMLGRTGCDFSFSGLKTAVLRAVRELGDAPDAAAAADLAAAFQEAVAEVLSDRTRNAVAEFRARHGAARRLVVAGGVAANRFLRARIATLAASEGMEMIVPPPALCTDTAAMIAWAGIERLGLGLSDPLDTPPRARWPLDA